MRRVKSYESAGRCGRNRAVRWSKASNSREPHSYQIRKLRKRVERTLPSGAPSRFTPRQRACPCVPSGSANDPIRASDE
jgi:hypothetical protein